MSDTNSSVQQALEIDFAKTTATRGGATQHHVMSIFADSARTKMYGSLRERAGGSCRVQVTLF